MPLCVSSSTRLHISLSHPPPFLHLLQTNSRLKQIEKEYSQKLAKSAQLIAELQTSVCESKEENVRLQQAKEKQLKEANARWDEERRTITQHADQACKVCSFQTFCKGKLWPEIVCVL
ncbi:unnamed protein product, partial [Menidia menidia]